MANLAHAAAPPWYSNDRCQYFQVLFSIWQSDGMASLISAVLGY